MNKKPTDDQFDSVVYEFIKTYKVFEKAAKKLMSIMESMNRKKTLAGAMVLARIESIPRGLWRR